MKDSDYHKIEAYLGGNLSETERLQFEMELEQDPELYGAFEISKAINFHLSETDTQEVTPKDQAYIYELKNFLHSSEAQDIKQKLKAGEAHFRSNQNPATKFKFVWSIAASLVLFMGIAGYLFFNTNPSNLSIYEEYYSENDLPSLVSRGDTSTSLSQGLTAFDRDDYRKAAVEFDRYLTNTLDPDPRVYLYLGASYSELNNTQKALEAFDALIASNSLDASKGLWFKALTLVKADQIPQAREVLVEITTSTSNYNYELALELLGDL